MQKAAGIFHINEGKWEMTNLYKSISFSLFIWQHCVLDEVFGTWYLDQELNSDTLHQEHRDLVTETSGKSPQKWQISDTSESQLEAVLEVRNTVKHIILLTDTMDRASMQEKVLYPWKCI